jgi:hypothetical protein
VKFVLLNTISLAREQKLGLSLSIGATRELKWQSNFLTIQLNLRELEIYLAENLLNDKMHNIVIESRL